MKEEEEDPGYATHKKPIVESLNGVPVLRVPDEEGYFPTTSSIISGKSGKGTTLPNVKLYQMHPKHRGSRRLSKKIATGDMTLHDAITSGDKQKQLSKDVSIIGECGGISFYLKTHDVVIKVSATEYVLMLPEDCLIANVTNSQLSSEDNNTLDSLLQSKTSFRNDHEEQIEAKKLRSSSIIKTIKLKKKQKALRESAVEDSMVSNDILSKSVHQTSKRMSKLIVKAAVIGSRAVEDYGQYKTSKLEPSSDDQTKRPSINETSKNMAQTIHSVSETTSATVNILTDKLTDAIGIVLDRTVAKNQNSTARAVAKTSALAYAEVMDGFDEAYDMLVESVRKESKGYVSKKYGEEVGEMTSDVVGAAGNFGSAVLTVRRIVSVKGVAKAGARKAAMSQ